MFRVVALHGFFNLSTWLTAIAGAAVLLLVYHLVAGGMLGEPAPAGLGARPGPVMNVPVSAA